MVARKLIFNGETLTSVDEGWSFLVFASYADRWPQSGNGRRYEEEE